MLDTKQELTEKINTLSEDLAVDVLHYVQAIEAVKSFDLESKQIDVLSFSQNLFETLSAISSDEKAPRSPALRHYLAAMETLLAPFFKRYEQAADAAWEKSFTETDPDALRAWANSLLAEGGDSTGLAISEEGLSQVPLD